MDFVRIIKSFEIKLTVDESNLLYLIIFSKFSDTAVAPEDMFKWMMDNYGRRKRTLINYDDLLAESTTKAKKKIEMPEIFKDVIRLSSSIGFSQFEKNLDFVSRFGK